MQEARLLHDCEERKIEKEWSREKRGKWGKNRACRSFVFLLKYSPSINGTLTSTINSKSHLSKCTEVNVVCKSSSSAITAIASVVQFFIKRLSVHIKLGWSMKCGLKRSVQHSTAWSSSWNSLPNLFDMHPSFPLFSPSLQTIESRDDYDFKCQTFSCDITMNLSAINFLPNNNGVKTKTEWSLKIIGLES